MKNTKVTPNFSLSRLQPCRQHNGGRDVARIEIVNKHRVVLTVCSMHVVVDENTAAMMKVTMTMNDGLAAGGPVGFSCRHGLSLPSNYCRAIWLWRIHLAIIELIVTVTETMSRLGEPAAAASCLLPLFFWGVCVCV